MQARSLRSSIKELPLTAFFFLAFLISAATWVLVPALEPGNQDLIALAGMVGSFGPALAAMIVGRFGTQPSDFSLPAQRGIPRARVIMFFTVLVISSAAMLTMMTGYTDVRQHPLLLILGGVGVVLAALTAAVNLPLDRSLKQLLFPGGEQRFHPLWCLAALAIFPVLNLLGRGITAALGGSLPPYPPLYNIQELLIGLGMTILITLFFGGPLGEEPGWRGFAMPRLLARLSPLVATLILGTLWSFWHTPLHANGFYTGGVLGVLFRLIFNIPVTFIFTWFYLRTRGSLWVAILLHTSVNVFYAFIPETDASRVLTLAVIVIMIVAGRMWKNPVPIKKMTEQNPDMVIETERSSTI